jgi:bacterioferritin-associated ferredoxin
MIVCLCHRISDRHIEQSVKDGVRDFEALQDETCLARNCGCCEDTAREVFDNAVAVSAATTCRVVPIGVQCTARRRETAAA